jgi:hypothetical protein
VIVASDARGRSYLELVARVLELARRLLELEALVLLWTAILLAAVLTSTALAVWDPHVYA